MAKYYATGTKKVEVKNEQGKKSVVETPVVIEFDSLIVNTRVQAVNEAKRWAKKDSIVLDGIDGVHVLQGTQKGGDTLTKRIQVLKATGKLPKF
jgi:hypothetical protein